MYTCNDKKAHTQSHNDSLEKHQGDSGYALDFHTLYPRLRLRVHGVVSTGSP